MRCVERLSLDRAVFRVGNHYLSYPSWLVVSTYQRDKGEMMIILPR